MTTDQTRLRQVELKQIRQAAVRKTQLKQIREAAARNRDSLERILEMLEKMEAENAEA